MTLGQAAALAAAKGRAKAAVAAGRRAVQQLALAESEFRVVGDRRVRTVRDAQAAGELIELARQNYGEVDVVVLTSQPKPHRGQGDNP